jgi:hypothetical protein
MVNLSLMERKEVWRLISFKANFDHMPDLFRLFRMLEYVSINIPTIFICLYCNQLLLRIYDYNNGYT